MLVSAISADHSSYISRALNPNYGYMNSKSGETIGDTAFNSLNSFSRKADMSKIYDSINEWKYFCEGQIEKGHLDIIA